MSHFYGAITQSARKTDVTARAHKTTGLTVEAMSYAGRIKIDLRFNEETGEDEFCITLTDHPDTGGKPRSAIMGRLTDHDLIPAFKAAPKATVKDAMKLANITPFPEPRD